MLQKYYFLMIEWNVSKKSFKHNGQRSNKPPTIFYRRLMRIAQVQARGKRVNQDKNGDMTRIFQEGMIISTSYSVITTLYQLLVDGWEYEDEDGNKRIYRPEALRMGTMEMEESPVISEEDIDAAMAINQHASLRGRQAKHEWVVTCYEEMETYEVEDSMATQCPHCRATNINARIGQAFSMKDPGGDLFEAWVRLHFASNQWEPPVAGTAMPPATVMPSQADQDAINELRTTFNFNIPNTTRKDKMDLLNAIWVNRFHTRDKIKRDARSAAIIMYMEKGGDPSRIEFNEPAQPDIFSAAGPIHPQVIAEYALRIL